MEKINLKKNLARNLGADSLISGDLYKGVAEAANGKLYKSHLGNQTMLGGFDLIYNWVGQSKTIHDARRWLKAKGGHVIFINYLFMNNFNLLFKDTDA